MEFLLIGDSKLKIVLNEEEINRYKLHFSCTDGCSSGFRRSFWKILEEAKSRVGFDPEGDKILIQLYPTKDGGTEIFVTKLGILSDASARTVSRSDRVTLLSHKRGLYALDSLEDVGRVAREAVRRLDGELPESDLFYDGVRYYLSVDEYGKGGEVMEFPFILEFASSVSGELYSYISEHAEMIAKGDAVKRFSTG